MEAQTQDASQNRFSWKRPSGREGLEHRLLREVASVCRLPRGKRLHLTCLGDPSVALRYPPRSHPCRLERSPAHLCPRLSFQGNRGGSWGYTTGDTDLSLRKPSPDVVLTPQDMWSRQLSSGPRGFSIRTGAITMSPSKNSQVSGDTPHSCCAPSVEAGQCDIPRPCLLGSWRAGRHPSYLSLSFEE